MSFSDQVHLLPLIQDIILQHYPRSILTESVRPNSAVLSNIPKEETFNNRFFLVNSIPTTYEWQLLHLGRPRILPLHNPWIGPGYQ